MFKKILVTAAVVAGVALAVAAVALPRVALKELDRVGLGEQDFGLS